MGLVMLASTKDIASAEDFADPPRETLGECVEHNVDPFVRVPAAEALARLDGRSRGYGILVELIAPANERAVRIEALNALTFLDHGQLTPFRAQIAEAAGDEDGYLRGAGRYLLFRLDRSYTPESAIFLWKLFEGTHNP